MRGNQLVKIKLKKAQKKRKIAGINCQRVKETDLKLAWILFHTIYDI